MLLHPGGDSGVPLGRIVAVLSLENISEDTEAFIAAARRDGTVIEVCPPPHKSCIIAADGRGRTVYLSPISAGTLGARAAAGVPGEM